MSIKLENSILSDFALEEGVITTCVNPSNLKILESELVEEERSLFRYYSDGALLCALLFFKNRKKVARVSFDFSGIAAQVFSWGAENKKSFAFIGGYEGAVEVFSKVVCQRHPLIRIVHISPGFFKSHKHRRDTIRALVEVDVIVAGMGSPHQERFLLDLRGLGWIGTGYTCGAFFEQTARAGGDYYPKIINELHLRWLFRLLDEPKKMFGRYFVRYPIFIWEFLRARNG